MYYFCALSSKSVLQTIFAHLFRIFVSVCVIALSDTKHAQDLISYPNFVHCPESHIFGESKEKLLLSKSHILTSLL